MEKETKRQVNLGQIFKNDQAKIIKQAILNSTKINNLDIDIISIGKSKNILISGVDLNDNVQYLYLTKESFDKLKKNKNIGGVI
jgi:hypothetical protein